MEAIVEIKGRQYRVRPGEVIEVDRLGLAEKARYSSDHVLLATDGKKVEVGTPYVKGVKVEGTVLGDGRYRKVTVGKLKKRKRYRRKVGHRQGFTRLKIVKVSKA